MLTEQEKSKLKSLGIKLDEEMTPEEREEAYDRTFDWEDED